jgi:hypothetical protein
MIGTVSFLKAVEKFKTQLSAGMIMASMFWDSEEVIHVDFLPNGVTINAQYYRNLLRNGVREENWKKRPVKLSKKIILLHINARPHGGKFDEGDTGNIGLGHYEQPSLQPRLSPQ